MPYTYVNWKLLSRAPTLVDMESFTFTKLFMMLIAVSE